MQNAAFAAYVLMVIALARPQRSHEVREITATGYDIILALDVSPSMLTEDYERDGVHINRLQALQPLLEAFLTRRPGDRIGVVVFSGRAYTLAPLTFNHAWLARQIANLKVGAIERGTAIGDGLATAVHRLAQGSHISGGKREGAFIVLLTDGANNCGLFDPLEAASLAKTRGIPVHTIAIGTLGRVSLPVTNDAGVKAYRTVESDLDEATLWRISTLTGGTFFRGSRPTTVSRAFTLIDQSRKIEFATRTHHVISELFPLFLWPASILLGAVCAALALPLHWKEKAMNKSANVWLATRTTARHAGHVFGHQARHLFI